MVTSVNLINTLSTPLRIASNLITGQEKTSGLAHTRFVQDTVTNLGPKATFARSKADLAENTFLELTESVLVYYCPVLLGEELFRKIYSKGLSKEQQKNISTSAKDLLKKPNINNKKLMPVKAAIALGGLMIPFIEYSLNYTKNLMTLKVFKQGNFDNIANLNKDKIEQKSKQEQVKSSALKHLKIAAGLCAAALLGSAVLAKKGGNSKTLQNISEFILAPGSKLFKKDKKKAEFFDKYCSIDFDNNNGKLALSKGQITACVAIGGVGYFGAAKDRGKQNYLETLYRYPLVGFYVITGGDLLDKGFKKILKKAGKCKDMIDDKLNVPKMEDLPKLAQKLSQEKNTKLESEYKSLVKQKTLITGVPFLFGLAVMGFFVAGASNLFTKYRFNKDKCKKNIN
ncbi:MAG: hypothetical protein PHE78_02100 [Candidatus Gastranaerophilales bacterium]|nr:hypothetical protein [Candidatus Gastranaerophilales bacterium]